MAQMNINNVHTYRTANIAQLEMVISDLSLTRMHAGMYVCMNMLTGETSFVKPESLYAYYNAMLIQRINFLDMYVCMDACMHACTQAHTHTHTHTQYWLVSSENS